MAEAKTTKRTTKATDKMSPFEKETVEAILKVNEYKEACEANIVSILYRKPDLMYEANLKLTDFSNNIWKVYWTIANDIFLVEKKETLDDITVGLYLNKHKNLEREYEGYGGYETIKNAGAYIKLENFDGYLTELRKWNAVVKLAKRGFPIKARLSDYADMTAQQIYDEYNAFLNDTFANVNEDIESFDIAQDIDELIEELDQGTAVGLPYYNMPMLTKETGGQYLGSITLVGGLSNVGKSTFARTATIPSIIAKGERIVIMLNEDGRKKWMRELLVFVANNVIKFDLQKHVVRDGKYTDEVKDVLKKAAQWIKDNTQNHMITIVPFKSFSTDVAIKTIKKYHSLGNIKYYLLDTFKLDAGKVSEKSWLEMQQNMVAINDVIKPEANNLHILITFQLQKGSARQRYYTQDNVGVAKNIIDPVSTTIMIRDVLEDEYTGEKRELHVYKYEGKNNKSKIPVKLDQDKRYQILFIVKNREGSANQFQIVIEHDMSRNIMKEVGFTNVPIDF